MIDIPPINVIDFLSANLPQTIIAVLLSVIIMATGKTPKHLFLSSVVLLISTNVLIVSLWTIIQTNQMVAAMLIGSGVVTAYIWRDAKFDVKK